MLSVNFKLEIFHRSVYRTHGVMYGSCSWLTSPQLARMGEFISYLCVLLIVKFQVIFLGESMLCGIL